jgi:hypothetical protein
MLKYNYYIDNLSVIVFFLILILIIIYNLLPPEDFVDNSFLKSNFDIFFEITELFFLLGLIFYSINYNKNIVNSFLNCFMLSIAFIEHIRQIILYYTQYGRGLRNLITGLIYIILIVYNIIHTNYLFVGVWTLGLLMKIFNYLEDTKHILL